MSNFSLPLINPIDDVSWNEKLYVWQDANIFHTAEWAKCLSKSYGYKCQYIYDESSKLLIPLMEVNSRFTGRRAISLPFTDFCPILYKDLEIFNNSLEKLLLLGRDRKWRYLELRPGDAVLQHSPSQIFFSHKLNLSKGVEYLFSKLRSSNRRNIRKAIKSGVEIIFSKDEWAVESFYHLNCVTRKRHGLPPQPLQFFKNIFKFLIEKEDRGIVVLAKHENEIVGGAIYFYFKDTAIYKYGASLIKKQHLRANNLIMWEAIKFFAENGFLKFHFGRTESNNKGLLQFKRGWGVKELPLNYYKYDFEKKQFQPEQSNDVIFSVANRLFSKMPIGALRILGELLYKHVA